MHRRRYYVIRTIVRGLFWTAMALTLGAAVYIMAAIIAITEQESWK